MSDNTRLILYIVAGVLVVIAVAYHGYGLLFGGDDAASPEELARTAIESSDPEEQFLAVKELLRLGEKASPQLREVLAASGSAKVRTLCVRQLAALKDYDSVPAMLDALQDPSPEIRWQAGRSVSQMLHVDNGYRYDDPPEKRAPMVEAYRQRWQSMQDWPLYKKWRREHESGAR
jgi:hypothetical protein